LRSENGKTCRVRVSGDRRPTVNRRRVLGVGLSIVAHLIVLLVLLPPTPSTPQTFDPKPVTVTLVDAPPLFAAALRPQQVAPAPAKQLVRRVPKAPPRLTAIARRTPPRRSARAQPAADAFGAQAGPETDAELSDAQLTGAATAGSGSGAGVGGGRACDMAGRLQAALRKDPMVQTAVARFAGKAILVWDGDWVWMRGDDGKGLTAVRQAVMWEIAVAPRACRAEPVHGIVVVSASAAPGAARLAVGLNAWRWSDLLTPHPERASSER
jgi:hypothetical protein